MATEQEYLELEKQVNVDDIDFSDLEEQYAVTGVNVDNYVLVDGAPIAPESKVPALTKVLKKVFASAGEIVDGEDGFHMPIEDGKTRGFLFLQFKTAEMAEAAIKQVHGKKLDQKHRLLVNRLTDIEKYGAEGNVSKEFEPAPIEPFKSHGYLKSWLQDENGRDQFALHYSETVCVYWNKKNMEPEEIFEPRKDFTSTYAKWSPKGNLLFSVHPQGVQAWGGDEFSSVRKFLHSGVRLIDFSPNEKFMVTLSPQPITAPETPQEKAMSPFGPESEGHKLVIWDLTTGEPARTFALPPHLEGQKAMPWPLVKWSFDDKYCARQGPGALAIYETENFQLLDKKLVKIDEIMDFEWAPAGVNLANTKTENGSHILSYWTPESTNQTARVALMQIPSREVLRTINLFQVSDCKMHWQSEGKALCIKVDRHTKSGKTLFTNLEFFRTTEKDIPVEKVELKEVVSEFSWEPRSERFIIISRLDDGNLNPAIPKNIISFYAPETKIKGKISNTSYKVQKQFSNKHSNTILWSPKGRYAAVCTIQRNSGELEFYDVAFEDEKSKKVGSEVKLIRSHKYGGMTNIAWDPSGRILAAWSSIWTHGIDNGYKLFEFTGQQVREASTEKFKEFNWRPRPASLLNAADRKKVRQHMKEYSAQFEESDAMEADAAVREAILARRKALENWRVYRSKFAPIVKAEVEAVETIEEIKEEIIEEKEEILE